MSNVHARTDPPHHPADESLEPRELLADIIVYSSVTNVLTIDGTTTNDATVKSTVAGTTVATLTHPDGKATTQTFTITGVVDSVVFQGYAGNDFFDNRTPIPAQAEGGAGDDLVYGGSAADLVWGSLGDNYLDARAGHDQLFGGAGLDTLNGGIGNAGRDIHSGGAGNDRFLITDIIYDSTPADVRINSIDFAKNEPIFDHVIVATHSSWTDEDVHTVDQALAKVEQRTGNNAILKMPDGSALTFRRQGYDQDRSSLLLGWNSLQASSTLLDYAFEDPRWLHRTIYHDIDHNWENANANKLADTFTNLSGWTYAKTSPGAGFTQARETDANWWYTGSSTFSRDYGRSDPWEDWAVSVETFLFASPHR